MNRWGKSLRTPPGGLGGGPYDPDSPAALEALPRVRALIDAGRHHEASELAGATLMGPIADRPVLDHVTPVYPEWAKRDGVEGSVTVYFVVSPDGAVRENLVAASIVDGSR